MRRAFWAASALVAVLIGLAALAHAPPVRRYALQRAIAAVQQQFGIRLEAEELRYDLFALRVELRGFHASAGADLEPFFTAKRVAAQLPTSVLFGGFGLESLAIEAGQIRLTRATDGRTNLPATAGGNGQPAALRIGSLIAQDLSVHVIDAQSRTALVLPSIDITVSTDAGRVRLREPGRLSRGNVSTGVREVRGGLAFDGRALDISNLTIRTDELTGTLDGRLALLTAEPRAELSVRARADAASLARWAESPPAMHGEINVRGTIDGPFAALTGAVRVDSPRLQYRSLVVVDVSADAKLSSTVVRVDRLTAHVAGGRVDVAADVPLQGGQARVDVGWRGVDVETLTRALRLDIQPRASGRADGSLLARGPMRHPSEWQAEGHVQLSRGRTAANVLGVAGRVNLRMARGLWTLAAPRALSVGDIRVQPAFNGRIDFDAPARSTIEGRVDLLTRDLNDVAGLLRRIGALTAEVPALDGHLEAQATVSGRLDRPLVALNAEARVAEVARLVPDVPLHGPASVQVQSDLRTASIKVDLPDIPASVDGVVNLRAPYKAEGHAIARGVRLEKALEGIQTPARVAGTVSLSARASGLLSRWQDGALDVQVDALDAQVGALPVRLASAARGSVRAGVAEIASLEIIAGETRLAASGRLPLTASASESAEAMLFTAAGDLNQFVAAAAATRMVQLPDVRGSGPAALLARITGSVEEPRISADLELGPGSVQTGELPPITNLTLRVHSDGRWVELRDGHAEWQGSVIEARGSAPIDLPTGKAGVATLQARVTSISQRVLEPFLDAEGLGQIEGSVDATAELQTSSLSLNDISGEVRLDRMEIRVADLPVAQREPTRMAFRGGFAEIAAWHWTGQGASLELEGRLRLEDRAMALIAGGQVDLRMLRPFTREAGVLLAGSVEPRLSITGTIESPRVDGVAVVSNADIQLLEPRVIAAGLDGRVVLTGSRAHLTSLSGAINGGSLSGSGSATYAPGEPVEVALGVEVGRMALELPEGMRSELDASLRLTVAVPEDPGTPSGKVSGSITVLRSSYREPIAVATQLLTTLRARQVASAVSGTERSLIDNLALDIGVVTADPGLTVDNNIGRLALSADLRVIGTLAAPALSGQARLSEGGQLFLGRNRYEITSGTIDFANPVAIEPLLNIIATTRVAGEEIILTITGSVEEPDVQLTSSNDQLSPADLYSLLLTGRRLDEISGDEAEIVGEQALAFLSGEVLGFASRAVGLDVIRLGAIEDASTQRDPLAVAAQVDPTARLTFGKSIGPDIDVAFSQGLRDADAQTWIVDYRPWRRVEFRFVSDDENLRAYEFRHDLTFGAAPRSSAPQGARESRRQPRIASLSIEGAAVVPEDRLRGVLQLEAGDEFDFATWQDDRDRIERLLHDAGFCEARVSARHAGGQSVTLAYSIVEGPLCIIQVNGGPVASSTIEALRRAWQQAVFDEFFLDEARSTLADSLAREGYPRPSVTVAFSRTTDRKTLEIGIDPGQHVDGYTLRFDGAGPELESALREWASRAVPATRSGEERAALAHAVTAWLRARGHIRARVRVEPPLVEDAIAIVPVIVDPGPAFTIGEVRLLRAREQTIPNLLETVAIAVGDPFDPAVVESARDRLQALYRREGFTSARVETKPSIDEASQMVSIAFDIEEGPRQVLREVQVAGNRAIDDDVITRALALRPGEPITTDDWLQARRRLFDTGLFRRADVIPEAVESSTPNQVPMRARVVVEEWPALRVRYGFEVTEERPEDEVTGRDVVPGVSADVSRRTLFGRAVSVGAALNYQRREQSGRAFLTSRSMFGWPIESSLLVERSRETFASADLATHLTGASWEQQIRAWRDLRLSYSYRFERNRTFRTTVVPGDEFGFDLTVKLAWLNATAAWDRRDNVADPSRGWLVSSSFDWAPAALGTDFRFVKHLGQAYYFRPWRGVVFASAARVGIGAPLDGQDLVPSERYFAGGSRTVRGVAEDTLGPRLGIGGAAGGESLVVLNQEVRFPIYRWVRGVAFVDGGNVFAEASGIRLGDLVTTFGAGLRVTTPFTLIRIDYGRLFSRIAGEPAGRWTFGFGHAF